MAIWTEDRYEFYYLTKTKSRVHTSTLVHSALMENVVSVTQDIRDEAIGSSISRFEQIANYFLSALNEHGVKQVFLEGYSLGSRGKVFSIAENTAVLKYLLRQNDMDVTIYPPTVIKKYATGKGNSGKDIMKQSYEQLQLTSDPLSILSHYKESPYTDCIDAYWILSYGLDQNEKT